MKKDKTPLGTLKWAVIFTIIGFILILFGSAFDENNIFKKVIDLLAGAFFIVGVMDIGILHAVTDAEFISR